MYEATKKIAWIFKIKFIGGLKIVNLAGICSCTHRIASRKIVDCEMKRMSCEENWSVPSLPDLQCFSFLMHYYTIYLWYMARWLVIKQTSAHKSARLSGFTMFFFMDDSIESTWTIRERIMLLQKL